LFTPADTVDWGKLFSYDDGNDRGWYVWKRGFQAWPNPVVGEGRLTAGELAYVAVVSPRDGEIEVFFRGERVGAAPSLFTGPPASAIFFSDDRSSSRNEQIGAVVEAVRISRGTRSASELANSWQAIAASATPKPAPIIARAEPVRRSGPFPVTPPTLRQGANRFVGESTGGLYFTPQGFKTGLSNDNRQPYIIHKQIARFFNAGASAGAVDKTISTPIINNYYATIQSFSFSAGACSSTFIGGWQCAPERFNPDLTAREVHMAVTRGADGGGRAVAAIGYLRHDHEREPKKYEHGLFGEFATAVCTRGWWTFGLRGESEIANKFNGEYYDLVWVRSANNCSFSGDLTVVNEFASIRAKLMHAALIAAGRERSMSVETPGYYKRECPPMEIPGLRPPCRDVWVPGAVETKRKVPSVAEIDKTFRTTPPG
jgi:hypothetical protein